MKCRIAEIDIEMNISPATETLFEEYKSNFSIPELRLNVSQLEVQTRMENGEFNKSYEFAESFCHFIKLSEHLTKFNSILLHGAVIRIGNRGIVFCAKGGTGKTTHMLLWKELFKDNLTIINGDKPIIRFKEDTPYAFGTPWCGKEGYSVNDSVILTDICFIERAEENSIKEINPTDAVRELISQTLVPNNPNEAFLVLGMVDKLLRKCSIWKIYCNKDIEAAKIASKEILCKGD